MTKTKLIQVLADRLNLTKQQATLFLDALYETAVTTLKAEGSFVVPGMVKFTLKDKPATPERQGRNPFTKEAITIPAKPASKKLRAAPVSDLKKTFTA